MSAVVAVAGMLVAAPIALAFENPSTASCAGGVFEPGAYPKGAISIVATHELGDAANQHVTDVHVRCVGPSADAMDFCGTADHTAASGYVDRSTPFAGRLLITEEGSKVEGFASGAGAAKRCRAVMGR